MTTRHRYSMWERVAGAAALFLAMTGCETPPKADTAKTASQVSAAGIAADTTPGDPTMSALAGQAAADVAFLLGNNSESSTTNPQADQPASIEPAEVVPAVNRDTGRRIVWNDASADAIAEPVASAKIESTSTLPGDIPVSVHAVEEPALDPPVTAPAETLEPVALQQLITDMSRELHRNAAYSDMPLRELLAIAALSLVDEDRALNPDALPDLSDRERELLGTLQGFFVELGNSLDGSKPADEVIADSVATLRGNLESEEPLGFGTVALVSRVGGFGDFDEIRRRAFLAHAEERFGLYVEIENFASRRTDQGEHITELSRQLVIYADADGIPVWQEDWQPAVDRSKRKRRDFFLAQLITLPHSLSVGKYHLKVRIRDDQTAVVAETAVPFQMVADARLAK